MTRISQTYLGRLLLAAVTLALLSLPFAHRSSAAPASPEMVQFLAMGGSFADICGDIDTATTGNCESCRVVAAMHLAPPVQVAHPVFIAVEVQATPNPYVFVSGPALHRSPPVRAPPRA
ncbi:hypothetical protein [uncultured Sulfitobacter sp.]|uniref:hypothetical protein n=1 Tax=uncultured Sulfitobacter sp. TaxID=191468 RepID=UPI002616351E|nr:hypothetical protein [uncultured Sulfitobacter sp.]